MINNFLILEDVINDYSIYYKIGMWGLVIFCLTPWIVLIFIMIFKKYRIRFIDGNGIILSTKKYKNNQLIEYPSNVERGGFNFIGWFEDNEYTIPFIWTNMPKRNLKAYGKWQAIESNINEEI